MRFSEALDRHITGNYGEDQVKGYNENEENITYICGNCGRELSETYVKLHFYVSKGICKTKKVEE